MANEKRKRSANWMVSEKTLLVDLVTKHFHVIENKRTDGVSMKKKLGEWITIATKFNSQTTLPHRTADNLKAQWERLKKSVKKAYKSEPKRREIKDPLEQKILCLIIPSAAGLHNPFDKFKIETNTHLESLPVVSDVNVIDTVPGPEIQNNYSTDSAASSPVCTAIEDCISNKNKVPVVLVPTPFKMSPQPEAQMMSDSSNESCEATNTEYIVDWGDYVPEILKKPISKPLQGSTEENRKQTVGKRLKSKRQPQLSTSPLGKLHKLRANALTIQMKHAAEEREEAKKLSDIQIDIQREILKQEKIKTRLLLLELRRNKRKYI